MTILMMIAQYGNHRKKTNPIKTWAYWHKRDARLDMQLTEPLRTLHKKYPKKLIEQAESKARSSFLYTYVISMKIQINKSYDNSTALIFPWLFT